MKLTIPALLAIIAPAVALPTEPPPSIMRRQQDCEACRQSCSEAVAQSGIAYGALCALEKCATKVRYLPSSLMTT